MNAPTQLRPMFISDVARYTGRLSGVLLLFAWSALVVSEFLQFGAPAARTVPLGVAFAVIFAGYAIGWRNEFVGGIVTLIGMVSLIAAAGFVFRDLPQPAVIWFAAPGLLYLFAWNYDRHHKSIPGR